MGPLKVALSPGKILGTYLPVENSCINGKRKAFRLDFQ